MSDSETEKSELMNTKIEKLKRERKTLRRLFTLACNQFDELLKNQETESKEILVLFNKVLDKSDRLFNIDSRLAEVIEYSDEDFELIESYRERFIEIKTLSDSYNQSYANSVSNLNTLSEANLKLPKLTLKEFDLTPRTWVAFWGQFSGIHEDKRLKEEDKFQYLLSVLKPKTKARDIADSYPPSKENYQKVIDHLKSRFGREDLLIEVYIRELLALVSNKGNIKLNVLYDKLGTYLRALETLGVTTANYAAMLYPVVESCLPIDVLKAWDRHRLNRESDSTRSLVKEKLLEELMSFLRNEVEGEEHRILAETGFVSSIKNKKVENYDKSNDIPSASVLVSSSGSNSSYKLKCIFCDKGYIHNSQDCDKASQMSVEDKKSVVIKKRCCLVCLKFGHMAKRCHSSVKCIICSKRHYAVMCPELSKREFLKKEESTSLFTGQSASSVIYLKTLMVAVRNKDRLIYVRALLDDGSHRSYIEESLAKQLKLSPSGRELLSQGLFGGGQTAEEFHGRYDIQLENLENTFSCQISVLDQPKICSNLPRVKDTTLIQELKDHGIKLTDIGPEDPPIRMLLGADTLGKILTGKIVVLKSGISAIQTKFGWSIMGAQKRKCIISMMTMALQNIELPKLWDLETLGITDPVERKSDEFLNEETLLHFEKTVRVNEDGRYEVTLPWLTGHPPLSDHYDITKSRLLSLTKRVSKEKLYESYDSIFSQWEKEGIIENVPTPASSDFCHYLPHRPVIKMSSNTTKIRPVFDASAKLPGSTSLNDCLSIGPNLAQQIPPLLLKFRIGSIGVTADIKQAFLQLSVHPKDRDVLRFLWWEDSKCQKIKTFRHCRVVFGVSSSPFLLNATIKHHLNSPQYKNSDMQQTIVKLEDGFYVDNLVTSVNSENELQLLMSQAKHIMSEGNFDLRCWVHNGSVSENQMLLGLMWNTRKDELSCIVSKEFTQYEPITKRKLLSVMNSVFDPIGFVCPALLLPKLLLQEAWRQKIEWDQLLPNDIQKRFCKWIKNIHYIEQCSIPRRLFRGNNEKASLHVFTDASNDAYACCAFLRSEDETGVSVKFISAKSRVAPMKKPTIPRLELLGAAIGARLANTILQALQLPLKTLYWSDSMVVLSWISKSEPWSTFVGNRVKEIRAITDVNNWRFVPGDMNPADLPSRPCDWEELYRSQWWKGPKWLLEPENTWPKHNVMIPEEALLEKRKTVVTNASIDSQKKNFSKDLLYFSSYPKIVRMIAWIFRFYRNTKKMQKVSSSLTGEEIQHAETIVLKLIQSEWEPTVKEKYFKSIQFCEKENLLRVKTRLILSENPEDFSWPIVLPDHPIVRRLIEYKHKVLGHSGIQTTLSCLRERFWIPRGRRVIRETLRTCVTCKRYSSKQVTVETPPLPPDRVNRVAAFQVTGADLAGPLFLKGGLKAWIVLFTCGVYRAIHLELVTSLTSEMFIQALRRFIARRGRPSVMYTDNGTNFCGTARALQRLDWKQIESESALQQIKWHFNPPAAPWYGGWWERMVRSIKELLRRNLGRASLNYEEMVTVLCDVESTVNSRPLTYLSDDPNELKPLTPAHFIQDIRGETADLDIVDSKYFLRRARYVQILRERLRKRFKDEYLAELVKRPQINSKGSSLAPGDIVLVGADNLKRINWPIAKVIELFPGKDNNKRVAKLRVSNGVIVRPLQRLYPLELHHSEFSDSNQATLGDDFPVEQQKPVPPREDISVAKTPVKAVTSPRKTRCGRQVRPLNKLNL